MNAGQYEGLMARLGEILDRMPERPAPEPFTVNHMDGTKTVYTQRTSAWTAETDKLAGVVKALTTMADVARGWSDHQPFSLADVLQMIEDAAEELGVEVDL